MSWQLPPQKFTFLDFDEYHRLVESGRRDEDWLAMVVTAGDAGLRMGELLALEWGDLDLVRGVLTVRRSNWRGHIGAPKGGRERTIPMTLQLQAALKAHRHLRGPLVFCAMGGEALTHNRLKNALWRICRRAGLREIGWHALRHTFCSHLAMRGAAPKAIQELAGHTSMGMTMRYMHLAPTVLRDTVRLLDERGPVQPHGTYVAHGKTEPAQGG